MSNFNETLANKREKDLYDDFCDPLFDDVKPFIAKELIDRVNKEGKYVDQEVIYDCMSCLGMLEVLEYVNSSNPCIAYLANNNINNRISDSKSSELFSDGRVRAKTKIKTKKRGKKLGYDK